MLLGLLPFVFVGQNYLARALTVLLLVSILGAMSLRLANVMSLQSLVKQNAIARSAAYFLKKLGRGSFGWRLSQDEKHVRSVDCEPLFSSAAGTCRPPLMQCFT